MDKLINNDIASSFKETLKKRIDSSIYGTFVIYWIIFHWNFIFTIFFVSEDKIWDSMKLLKNDYLVKVFFNFSRIDFYFFWILPALFTYLTIWVFPKWLIIPSYKKEQIDETEKIIFKIDQEREIEIAKTKREQERAKKVEAVSKQVIEKSKIKKIDPTAIWEEDYRDFTKSPYFAHFSIIIASIYEHNGNVEWYIHGNPYLTTIPKGILAYTHTHELIEFGDKNKIISLTDKGKFFVKKYSSEKNI